MLKGSAMASESTEAMFVRGMSKQTTFINLDTNTTMIEREP